MIDFAFPWALLLLPLPLLVHFLIRPRRQEVKALRSPFFLKLAESAGVQPQAGSVVLSRGRLQMLLAALIWGLVVLALARPERVGEPIEIEKSARDVVLAIDISGSMDEHDMTSADGKRLQRLEVVKRVVGKFIEEREGDRIALVVFGSRAFIQSPFTEDLATVRALMDEVQVGMAGPHTVIGDAIGLSIRMFQASEIDQRLLIVLSDGADTGSRMTPINAAEIAGNNGVEIHTIAVGDPQANGDLRVDTKTLSEIANRTGGSSFLASDETGLTEVYDRIEELTPRTVETLSFRPREPLGHILLALAACLGFLGLAGTLLWANRRQAA